MKTNLPLALSFIALSLLLAGCQSAAPTKGGFLKDYGNLSPSAAAPGAMVYRQNPFPNKPLEAFTLEPLSIAFASEAQQKMADPQREAEVRKYLTAKLEDGFKARVKPGAGGLKVKMRAAITDVDPAHAAGTFRATATPGTSDYGRGTLEVEMIDLASGQVVLAFIDRRDRVRPSGPQQTNEAKLQVDDAIARLLAEYDAAVAGK